MFRYEFRDVRKVSGDILGPFWGKGTTYKHEFGRVELLTKKRWVLGEKNTPLNQVILTFFMIIHPNSVKEYVKLSPIFLTKNNIFILKIYVQICEKDVTCYTRLVS